jgi:hypothetical protein
MHLRDEKGNLFFCHLNRLKEGGLVREPHGSLTSPCIL